jgi:hypothetical protein
MGEFLSITWFFGYRVKTKGSHGIKLSVLLTMGNNHFMYSLRSTMFVVPESKIF